MLGVNTCKVNQGINKCVILWRFLIVTGDLRTSHPVRHQVTLPLTNVSRVNTHVLRQSTLNLSKERTIWNLVGIYFQHPCICSFLNQNKYTFMQFWVLSFLLKSLSSIMLMNLQFNNSLTNVKYVAWSQAANNKNGHKMCNERTAKRIPIFNTAGHATTAVIHQLLG